MRINRIAALLASVTASALPTFAFAQEQTQDGLEVDEIVVTAQRREESLQDVPIAVTAIEGDELLARGVIDTQNLTALVPTLQFGRQNNAALPFLRGIGSNNGVAGNESSIAVYVDGVYRPSLTGTLFGLSNIERIEVLKGPQGTLFGRNATGGVVQVVTAEPSSDPVLRMSAGYGNYDTIDYSLFGTTGVGSQLSTSLSLYGRNQQEGWGRNLTTGAEVFTSDEFIARNRWLWSDGDTDIGLNFSYNHSETDLGLEGVPVGNTVLVSGSTNAGFFNVYGGAPPESAERESYVIDAQFTQELGGGVLFRSITSYQDDTSDISVSQDQSQLNLLRGTVTQEENTWTQEFQLLSDGDGPLTWIAGAFFYESEAAYAPFRIEGPVLAPFPFQQIDSEQTTTSLAGYAQVAYQLTDATTATVGLRYTTDEHDFSGVVSTAPALPGPFPPDGVLLRREAQNSDSELTWRLALDHRFSSSVLGYVSYNRGFKSGQFNLSRPQDQAVLPEILDAYEVGLKTQLFDNRLRLNGSAFFYDYTDIQVQQINGVNIINLNAAAAEITGVDLEFDAVLTEHLTLQGGVAFLDGEYGSFANAPFFTSNAPFPGNSVAVGDASGNETIQSPRLTGKIGLQYVVPTSFGEVQVAGRYSYNSGYYFTPDNRLEQPEHHLVSASIGWTAPDDRWGVTLWGNNLLDEEYFYSATALTTGDFGVPGSPLSYGVRLNLNLQ